MELRTKPIETSIVESHESPGKTRRFVYEPGDGTRYELLIAPNPGQKYTTQIVVWLNASPPRAMSLGSGGFLSPDYVAQHMGRDHGASLYTITEIIAYLTGRETFSQEEMRERYGSPA